MSEDLQMQDYINHAQTILDSILHLMGFDDIQLDASTDDGQIYFQVVTADAGRIIGRTSQTLDALQFILNRLMSRKFEDAPYCVVDAEHYRERRREKLMEDANAALEHVRQTGRPWRMPLLNSMERRIIHQALKNCPDIVTQSEDEEPDGRKRVVVSLSPDYAPPAPAEDIPTGNDGIGNGDTADLPPADESVPPPPPQI